MSGDQQEEHSQEEEEGARRCSHCSCTWTYGAWRRHPATRAQLCNACRQFADKHAGQLPDKGVLERRERMRHMQPCKAGPRQCAECGSSDPSSGRSYAKAQWHVHPANPAQWLCMLCGARIQRLFRRQMNAAGQQAAPIDASEQAAPADASSGQQRENHAVLVAPNSAQVQQPRDVPQPCSTAVLLSDPTSTAPEVQDELESRTHGYRKRSVQGPQPRSSKQQHQEAHASVREQPDQRNNNQPTAPEAPQQEQPALLHALQQPQPEPASQLGPQPAVQQSSLYDLLMDAMRQPAAAAAGLTAEMAAGCLGLLPVQAEKVRHGFSAVVSGLPSCSRHTELLKYPCRSAAWWSCCNVDSTAWQRP
jgi:hypothetical protein